MAEPGKRQGRDAQWQCLYGALLLQLIVTLGAAAFLGLPVSTEVDSVEYVHSADNLLARGIFSIDGSPPYRPSGFRTPGALLVNVPLRLLSAGNDLAAAALSRGLVLVCALLCMINAGLVGLSNVGPLAGALLIQTPTLFYYSMLPYATELPYVIACNVLLLGSLLLIGHGRAAGAVVVGCTAFYALLLRPATMFVLIAYAGACFVGIVVTRGALRRRLLIAGIACLLGGGLAYVSWCSRNLIVFGAFRLSTVSADNLLRYGAAGMEPFLDPAGREELQHVLNSHRIVLQTYGGSDQFAVADAESGEALRLISEYPTPFLQSHLSGAIELSLLFMPAWLVEKHRAIAVLLTALHLLLLIFGALGLSLLYRRLDAGGRAALLIAVFAGVVSVLSGGSTHSPRFRIPLDTPLVLGCVSCLDWARSRRARCHDEGSVRSAV